jgi:predicted amidohydrolase YtcJ
MSVFSEKRTGTLAVGKLADFVIVDMDWDAKSLLQANIKETWFGGRKVWGK